MCSFSKSFYLVKLHLPRFQCQVGFFLQMLRLLLFFFCIGLVLICYGIVGVHQGRITFAATKQVHQIVVGSTRLARSGELIYTVFSHFASCI
jgi:hypothetical protein